MSHPRTADLDALLSALVAAQVEFIVVGGAAAVLHGAPVTTQDLDIVHRRTPKNVARLLDVLRDLAAVARPEPPGRRIRPTAEHLQINLSTSLGPLDAFCEIESGQGYEQLVGRTVRVSDGKRTLRVLDLPALIEAKSRTGRAKDRLVLPVLVALLDERSKRS